MGRWLLNAVILLIVGILCSIMTDELRITDTDNNTVEGQQNRRIEFILSRVE